MSKWLVMGKVNGMITVQWVTYKKTLTHSNIILVSSEVTERHFIIEDRSQKHSH